MKRESRGSVTCEDIFGEESSTSGTSDEEDLTQTAERPRKPPWAAPAKRMLLSLQQKLAAISHFQSNKMNHNELAQWMKKQFKLEKEIDRSTITKMFRMYLSSPAVPTGRPISGFRVEAQSG